LILDYGNITLCREREREKENPLIPLYREKYVKGNL
jgi:hypothetical protein